MTVPQIRLTCISAAAAGVIIGIQTGQGVTR